MKSGCRAAVLLDRNREVEGNPLILNSSIDTDIT